MKHRKGGERMKIVEFLAYRITVGLLEFKNVPTPLKDKVRIELEKLGLGFLAE